MRSAELRRFAAVLSTVVFAAAVSASALPSDFDIILSAEDVGTGQSLGTQDFDSLSNANMLQTTVDQNGVNIVTLTGDMNAGSGWSVSQADTAWMLDIDPFITNNFVVTNNTGGAATFTFTVSSGTFPAFNATRMIQSNIELEINDDDNAGGASASNVAPDSIYEAFVNGGSVLTLLDDPTSVSCTDPVDCNANGQVVDGIVSQSLGGNVAVTSIGITVKFTLSDGDSAAVLSRFEVIPEPGTALLLGLGLAGMAGARRRS